MPDYKKMWENLKQWMEEAMDEGHERGFDKGEVTFENGAFHAYHRVLEDMNRLEGTTYED